MTNEHVIYNDIIAKLSQKYNIIQDEKAIDLARILKNELNANLELTEAGILFYLILKNPFIKVEELKDLFTEDVLLQTYDSIKVIAFLFNTYHKYLQKILFLSTENKFRIKALENIKKFIFTIIQDFNSIFIVNAYYLLLLRIYPTLSEDTKEKVRKQVEFIFSPIAHRLGFYRIKSSFDDLLFKYSLPDKYHEIQSYVEKIKKIRGFIQPTEFNLDNFKETINRLIKEKISVKYRYKIKARIKSIASIYKKMLKKNQELESIKDIFALRIIFDVPNDLEENFTLFPKFLPSEVLQKEYQICWEAYSLITNEFEQIKFRNYISNPKPNGYQSLHVTVLASGNIPVEIQIRTTRMDLIAEKGDAAHWMYKEQGSNKINRDEVFRVLRELTEEQKSELHKSINEIYVFTPDMHLIDFPKDATVLDFAYAIHTKIGETCTGAQVSNFDNPTHYKVISYKEKLQNGWIVKILSSSTQKPSNEWLNIAKTTHARKKIKSYIKLQKLQSNIQGAKEMLERKLSRWGYNLSHPIVSKIMKELGYNEVYLFYNDIAQGKIDLTKLKNLIHQIELKEQQIQQPINRKILTHHVEQTDKVLVAIFENNNAKILFVSRARCCNAQPNDKINVYISPRSKTVHKNDCPELEKIYKTNPERVFPAAWVKPHKKLDINDLAREHSVFLLIVDLEKLNNTEILQTKIKDLASKFNLSVKRILTRQGKGNTLRVFLIIQGKIDRKIKQEFLKNIEIQDYIIQIRERKYNPNIRS